MAFIISFWRFFRLTRPLFLLGGVLLYALGAAFAWRQGYPISPSGYLLGQALVTAIQLMTHYANEYYDQDTDRLNTTGRTWFSGGSGVLVGGEISPVVAQRAGYVMAAVSIGLLILVALRTPALLGMGLLSLLAAWFYSAPPLALARTGWGELSASLVVALLVPLVSYTQISGRLLDPRLLLVCLPLVLVHWAMLIAFQIPDIAADRQAGKTTLAVRVGTTTAFRIHHLLIGMAVLAALLALLAGESAPRFAWLALPLAAWQIVTARAYLLPSPPRYLWLTMRALALFAVCTFLWLVGVALG